jgi:pyrroloquinoline-quinone synthase
MMITTHDPVANIDAVVARRHVLNHPFYQAWSRGELTMAALQDYARQYYHHVAAFPTYLSAVHAQVDDPAVRQVILANLVDEEGRDPTHPELWLRFAEGLGVAREDVRNTSHWAETDALISAFRGACHDGPPTDGLAALYAYECQQPAVAASKIDGLRQHYGVDDPRTLEYFSVHHEADVAHSADERALLAELLPAEDVSAAAAADTALAALWDLLSAVCQRHDIACDD